MTGINTRLAVFPLWWCLIALMPSDCACVIGRQLMATLPGLGSRGSHRRGQTRGSLNGFTSRFASTD